MNVLMWIFAGVVACLVAQWFCRTFMEIFSEPDPFERAERDAEELLRRANK